jgi:hypothetical protein
MPGDALVASDLLERPAQVARLEHPLPQVCPFPRRARSSCPSGGFIPWVVQGQLQLPHGCVAPARHDSSCPFSPSRGTVRALGSLALRLRLSVAPPFGCGVPHEPRLRRAYYPLC